MNQLSCSGRLSYPDVNHRRYLVNDCIFLALGLVTLSEKRMWSECIGLRANGRVISNLARIRKNSFLEYPEQMGNCLSGTGNCRSQVTIYLNFMRARVLPFGYRT